MVLEKLDHWKLSSVSPCQYPNAPARNKALARLRRGGRGWQHPAPCRPTVPTGVARTQAVDGLQQQHPSPTAGVIHGRPAAAYTHPTSRPAASTPHPIRRRRCLAGSLSSIDT